MLRGLVNILTWIIPPSNAYCLVQYFSLAISLKNPTNYHFLQTCLFGFACLYHFICLANLLSQTILWLSYREVPLGRTLGSKLFPVIFKCLYSSLIVRYTILGGPSMLSKRSSGLDSCYEKQAVILTIIPL